MMGEIAKLEDEGKGDPELIDWDKLDKLEQKRKDILAKKDKAKHFVDLALATEKYAKHMVDETMKKRKFTNRGSWTKLLKKASDTIDEAEDLFWKRPEQWPKQKDKL